MKKAHLVGIVLLAIMVIGGILLYPSQSKTPSQRVFLNASDIPGDNWTSSTGDNFISNTYNSSDSAVHWFYHVNESGKLLVGEVIYHYSRVNEAIHVMDESTST
jgi:hypothetical protein